MAVSGRDQGHNNFIFYLDYARVDVEGVAVGTAAGHVFESVICITAPATLLHIHRDQVAEDAGGGIRGATIFALATLEASHE